MSTNYGRSECVNAVWEKGHIINEDLKNKYGKYGQYGWNIDHIIPISRGGPIIFLI